MLLFPANRIEFVRAFRAACRRRQEAWDRRDHSTGLTEEQRQVLRDEFVAAELELQAWEKEAKRRVRTGWPEINVPGAQA
jgi:hypothetical protein